MSELDVSVVRRVLRQAKRESELTHCKCRQINSSENSAASGVGLVLHATVVMKAALAQIRSHQIELRKTSTFVFESGEVNTIISSALVSRPRVMRHLLPYKRSFAAKKSP